MVHLVNFFLFRHPAVLTVERQRYFGFQVPLPLFLLLTRHHHNAFSVPKRIIYINLWDVVFDTTLGTKSKHYATLSAND